jgi:hypothetical protein
MHNVHYREPSGKNPNAPLSSTGTSWEATTSTGQYQDTEGFTAPMQNLQNERFIASNSNCLPIADFTKDARAIRA